MAWYCSNGYAQGVDFVQADLAKLVTGPDACIGYSSLISTSPVDDFAVLQNQQNQANTQNQVLQGQIQLLNSQNSPFNLSLDDAQAIAVPILLVWAIAFVFRIIRKMLETTDSISD